MNRKLIYIALGTALTVLVVAGVKLQRSARVIDAVRALPVAEVKTPTPVPPVLTMLFAGDIMLGRNVEQKMLKSGKGDHNFPFEKIAQTISEADLAFANLEGPISSRGVLSGSKYSFRFDPKSATALRDAGFDVVSVANNHMWDYGRQAFLDTLTHLASAGISFAGAGRNATEAYRPVTRTLKDGTRVAFLAYTEFLRSASAGADRPGIAFLDEERMVRDIKAAKLASDIVVASFHMGDEYQTRHNAKQGLVFKKAVDAGADLVIGHHPHVVQEVEKYKHGWIAYSLGNFIFDQYFSEGTMRGLMLKAVVRDKKVKEVQQIKTRLNGDYQVYLDK